MSDAEGSLSASKVSGTPGFIDPLMVNSRKHSVLSDGFALGITLLMTLVGLPALDIRRHCRNMLRFPEDPSKWSAPGVPDGSAGEWPADVMSEALEVVVGLSKGEYADERMPLPEALRRLESLVDAAPPEPEGADDAAPAVPPAAAAAPAAAEPEVRMCIVCEAAPREVRFRCGHACCCRGCVARVQAHDDQCPQCRAPLGADPIAGAGAHVQLAATFQIACAVSSGAETSAAGVSAAGASAGDAPGAAVSPPRAPLGGGRGGRSNRRTRRGGGLGRRGP